MKVDLVSWTPQLLLFSLLLLLFAEEEDISIVGRSKYSSHIIRVDVSVHTRERVKREKRGRRMVKRIKEQKRVVCVHGQYF